MRLKILLWTIVLFALPAAATAQESKEALIQTLYIKSGIDQQARQVPDSIQAGFEHGVSTHKRLREMPQGTITQLRAALKTAFTPERIKIKILIAFRKKLTVDDLKQVLAWLDSSTGKKISQLEEAASRSNHFDGLRQFEAQLQAASPPPKRRSIIRQLDSVSRATDTRVDVALKAQLAVAMVLVAPLTGEKKPTTEALAAAIEKNSRSLIDNAMRSETERSFLYTYDKLALWELDRYITFASSPAGARYHDAAAAGLNTALTTGCDKWRQLVETILLP